MPNELKWNSPANTSIPQDGEQFIYISGPDKQGNRLVSKACWRDADEDRAECWYDSDIGDEADIAGWLPMPDYSHLT